MSLDYGTPGGIADALSVAAAVVWLLIIAGSLARLVRSPRSVLAELRGPVFSPFWSLSPRTVETHLYRAMRKLGVSDRRDLGQVV